MRFRQPLVIHPFSRKPLFKSKSENTLVTQGYDRRPPFSHSSWWNYYNIDVDEEDRIHRLITLQTGVATNAATGLSEYALQHVSTSYVSWKRQTTLWTLYQVGPTFGLTYLSTTRRVMLPFENHTHVSMKEGILKRENMRPMRLYVPFLPISGMWIKYIYVAYNAWNFMCHCARQKNTYLSIIQWNACLVQIALYCVPNMLQVTRFEGLNWHCMIRLSH
jgi:hypothetical protein